jgi:prepilin-type N-terminal cleavage/methylation domain-containing protein
MGVGKGFRSSGRRCSPPSVPPRGRCFPPSVPPRGRKGFTIVEVLMVVAIMSLLFGLVMFATSAVRTKANLMTTKAMVNRLRDRIAAYKQLMGHCPPDGYDTEVKNAQGERVWGSAALYTALTTELTVEEKISGQVRTTKHPPLDSYKESELTKEDESMPGVREILDGFGLPFHYDNTEDGKFQPERQTENAHLDPVDNHLPDPRTSDDTDLVPKRGIQGRNSYDLWSHGSSKAHTNPKTSLKLTIGSWNVDVEKSESHEEE